MKNMKFSILLAIILTLTFGCNQLDYSEVDNYSKDQVFNEFGWNKLALTRVYSYLPTDFRSVDGAMRSSASDDAVHVYDVSSIHKFNNGIWSASQTLDTQWSNMYSGIRAANVYLAEAEGKTFDDIKWNANYLEVMAQYEIYPYEARFLRAYFYFELIKRYGAVPLITKVLTEEEANNVTRTPFADVVQFIVSECDSVMKKLPSTYDAMFAKETGRVTQGAAMALKARTLLYAASPLHNTTNDQTKWIAAATAAKAIIDLSLYSLPANFALAVNNLSSSELILERRQGPSNSFEAANFPIGYEGGRTSTCPTKNLVDAFEMKTTGLGINDSGSGYDPANPYANRDPRLNHTVLFNGATWKGEPVEIWNGAKNGPPIRYATKTGFYLKKYLIEAVSLNPVSPSTREHFWVLFRYAEVLLNYAEAMNEAYGPAGLGSGSLNMTALQAVNKVRERATMPVFPASMSQADFRTKLRNERRVELAFEDHRFWDIRRWKVGNSTREINGVNIMKDVSGALTYTQKLVENRIWDDRMYLYPIPQSELFINDKLTQNTGW